MTTWPDVLAEVGNDPDRIDAHFASAMRSAAADGRDGDVAREALLLALPGDPTQQVLRLYWQGDPAERLAVLRALPSLDDPSRPSPLGDAALPIVRDALRTNDTRLVAAAMGPYAAQHLDDASWRQAMLKFLFVGVPVAAAAGVDARADAELGRMVRDYVAERQAAGREVPADAITLLTFADAAAPVPESPVD